VGEGRYVGRGVAAGLDTDAPSEHKISITPPKVQHQSGDWSEKVASQRDPLYDRIHAASKRHETKITDIEKAVQWASVRRDGLTKLVSEDQKRCASRERFMDSPGNKTEFLISWNDKPIRECVEHEENHGAPLAVRQRQPARAAFAARERTARAQHGTD
jgi:hypothetical protein